MSRGSPPRRPRARRIPNRNGIPMYEQSKQASILFSAARESQQQKERRRLIRFIHAINTYSARLMFGTIPFPLTWQTGGCQCPATFSISSENDTDAIDKAKVIAIGVSLDRPAVDPERQYHCDRRCRTENVPGACIFQAFSRTPGPITRRGLTLAPATDRTATR
jgi:alpha-D-ribose 1-methylphosphonate 5-phosphate C-P lyase